jgi:purine-binding chemotaxis protein CheW
MASSGDSHRPLLICRVGSYLCGLALEHVVETMRPLPTEPLAGTADFIRGVSVIRGDAVPVVDVGMLLAAGDSQTGRIVLIRVGGRSVALAVESVFGVEDLAGEVMSDLPPLLGGVSGDAVTAIAALDSELLVLLDDARLVPASTWAALEGKVAVA